MCLSLDHHRVYSAPRSPGGRERPGAARGLPAGSARAPAGRRFGGAPKPRRGPGPTRERRGAPSGPAAALASLCASPARPPEGTEQNGDYYPIIVTCTVATMQAGNREPRAGNRKAGRPAPRLPRRVSPLLIGEHEPGETRRSGGKRSRGERARGPVGVAARGEARRAWPNCPAPPAGPALQPQPGRGGERGWRHKAAAAGAMNRAFSQCVVQAWPPRARVRGRGPARPEPAAVTQGRPRSLGSRPQRPPPTSPPARPPFRPAAARRLRPRPAPGLGRRGPSHCDTAAPGRACAAPLLGPGAATLTRMSRNGPGDVSTWSLGLGPG